MANLRVLNSGLLMGIRERNYEKVKSFVNVLKISDVQIRGKANKMDIYEVLDVEL